MEHKKGFIYALQHPETLEIFYIGATTLLPSKRLRQHYMHLKEAEEGKRNMNKRLLFLKNMLPVKPLVITLDVVNTLNIYDKEKHYIKFFKKQNLAKTNMTDGGKGSYTSKYFSDDEKSNLASKISKANKGRKKPLGFSEKLSKERVGLGNPAAKELPNWLVCLKDKNIVMLFKYGFEVNQFINNKYAYGNVYALLKRGGKSSYGYTWVYYNTLNKDDQLLCLDKYRNKNNGI